MSEEEKIIAAEEKKKQKAIDKEIQTTKRTGKDAPKTHGEILRDQITDAQETYEKSPSSILASSMTAGLEIGFSFLMICSVFYFLEGKMEESSIFKMIALVYPLGFILVVMGQSILFTEQTALLTLPVLNNKRTIGSMLRLWGLVICGNLIGGYMIALLLNWLGPRLGIFNSEVVITIADHVLKAAPHVIFVSAIVAGWLMGLLSWLLASARDTISRIVMIFLITSVMAFTGLHHSIIGSVEVFSGMIKSADITFLDYVSFQSLALLGNAFGGAIFVGLLKYRAFVFNIIGK
ncbi:formate/nitrite transporter family protein [Algoriphagus pacificus]|uniref:Formate/nitrite transporter family protein n=1 Tax=Algoriphagus pacificus TaxID=2811234 RepID=A0ABS3CIT6_9BACT|nr:formate/nitrite transporter family protein [Algoriphagus pacificus]MBN7815559.1 formate/nitrite transporter family protein [Algoriphagus pacificus]